MGNIKKNWGSWDAEAAQEEQDQLDKSGAGEFWKPKSGKNKVRFLPPLQGMRSPFIVTNQHFVKLPGMTGPAVFNCPRKMGGGVCLVCQYAERLRGSGNRADYDLAGEMFPRVRVISNIIDRSDEDSGPQLFGFGKTIHEALIALRQDEDSGGDFTNPEDEGYDIIIEKDGEGLNTEYTVRPDRKSSPLGNMEWIEAQHDLQRFLKIPDPAEVQRVLAGAAGSSEAQGRGRGVARAALGAGGGGGGGARGRNAAPARGGAAPSRGGTATSGRSRAEEMMDESDGDEADA